LEGEFRFPFGSFSHKNNLQLIEATISRATTFALPVA
jgi:hypothetical protein